MTPVLEYGFPGLKPGDKWCVCALRWKEALNAGKAAPLILKATHEATLKYISKGTLEEHGIDDFEGQWKKKADFYCNSLEQSGLR